MGVKHKHLKWGVFESPSVKNTFERYVIENLNDLESFSHEFEMIKNFNIKKNMLSCLLEGYVIVATDIHPLTGYPTYCFEGSKDNEQPTSIYRIKLGNIE